MYNDLLTFHTSNAGRLGTARGKKRMRAKLSMIAGAAIAIGLAAAELSAQLPLGPSKERGLSVTGAYEGWYKNADGTFTLLIGYFNRNVKETFDIPTGPNNRIEPGGPDQGQPTYFAPRRVWGIFTITVPKDFGTKKLTWTITSNGETTSVPLTLNSQYEISPFKDLAMGNTPPTLRFSPNGPILTGPPRGIAASYAATTTQPATIELWVADKGNTEGGERGAGRGGPGVSISLHKFRGPGEVTFPKGRPEVGPDGRVAAPVTFAAPGEYIIRVQANDSSGDGGGGFQCCWTNAHVRVTVK
jgi:hypothetical protein